MKRGEDITLNIKFNEDISKYQKIRANVAQGYSVLITIPTEEIKVENNIVTFELSQQQTLQLHKGDFKVQIDFLDNNNKVSKSNIVSGVMGESLNNEVMQ